MNKIFTILMVVGLIFTSQVAFAESNHLLGVGAHYWKTLDNIDVDNVDESGVGWMLTYQYRSGALINFEADLEILPEDYAGAEETVFAPQAFVLIGNDFYGGLGVGTYYTDGEFKQDPFFALRVGFNVDLLPALTLDINANYRFEDWDDINNLSDDISTDTITLGAAVRLKF